MTFNKLIIARSAIIIVKQLESYLGVQYLCYSNICPQSVGSLLIKSTSFLDSFGECNTKVLVPLKVPNTLLLNDRNNALLFFSGLN